MSDDQITIEVDGQSFPAKRGQMLIEVTDANDIYIPRFCYHKKLTVAANCRMCLVEVEKAPKALPACATPVMDGMKVNTRSKKALEAQKAIMEFLLINHPLDCPICDQGGECELQDLAMGYGRDVSRYQEKKRVVKDKNVGSLIQTDLTRCIHCTRCVRFGEEVAGVRELGATGRGENMQIGTYIEKSIVSEMSANVIDLCPVGALTSKPFRYSARTWELVQRDAIAPHDSVGSNIHVHIKGDKVKRVVPAENEEINEVWLSDRDRFSYEAINSSDRLASPKVKVKGEWQTVDWETALNAVKAGLQSVINDHGAKQLGALASASSTTEELYLLQKLYRGLGSDNIDTRLRQIDFSDDDVSPVFPWLGQAIAELENLQSVLLVGSYVRKEQPIINHRIRKAALRGAKVGVVNPADYDFNFNLANKCISSPAAMLNELAAILKAVQKLTNAELDQAIASFLVSVDVNEKHENIASDLMDAENTTVLVGSIASSHPQFATIKTLAGTIAKLTSSTFGYLSDSANTSGAWLAGALPHRRAGGEKIATAGLNAAALIDESLKSYLLLGVEPELDCWNSKAAQDAMNNAEFVVALTAFDSEALQQYANVMLPISVFAETSGTYINNEGTEQAFNGVVPPQAEARPAWKVLRVLGNYFDLDGFDQQSSADVYKELINSVDTLSGSNEGKWSKTVSLSKMNGSLQRYADMPTNSVDMLTRRAPALQKTPDVADGAVHIAAALAQKHNLNNGDQARVTQDDNSLVMHVVIDNRLSDETVLIQAGHHIPVSLGAAYGAVSIEKA